MLNNTVINRFARQLSKREVDSEDYLAPLGETIGRLSLDCTGVQGSHRVMWTTDNDIIGNSDGLVNCDDERRNRQDISSNYSSQYGINYFNSAHLVLCCSILCMHAEFQLTCSYGINSFNSAHLVLCSILCMHAEFQLTCSLITLDVPTYIIIQVGSGLCQLYFIIDCCSTMYNRLLRGGIHVNLRLIVVSSKSFNSH